MSFKDLPNATWSDLFEDARLEADDTSPVVAIAPDKETMEVPFHDGFGLAQGPHILIWTRERVYFPVTYDGLESLGSAPRNPRPDGQEHVGGE